MNFFSRAKWAGAVGIGVGVVLAVSAATGAKPEAEFGKLKTVRASVTVPGIQLTTESVTAKCPKGSRAVSGGWTSDPLNADFEIFESFREGKRSWTVTGTQPNNNAIDTELTALAYCDESAPRARAVEVSSAVPEFGERTVDARCPKGTKATAGGMAGIVDFANDEWGFPLASHRTGKRTWSLRVGSQSGTPEATAIAYCTPGVKKVRTKDGSDLIPDYPGLATAASGKCKKKLKARAGGFEVDADAGEHEYAISESRRAGRRWVVSAHLFSAENVPVHAFAYCP